MRAVVISDGRLVLSERPDPEPGEGELLVSVEAAGLNGADILQRAGHYPPPPGAPQDIPGMECAGVVVSTGPGCSHQRGERVMALVGGGAQAELCLVADSVALAVPEGLGAPEAGSFPEVFTTAHDALCTQCQLSQGERLLVTGAAGGVGVAAIQLGRIVGAEVVASARRREAHPELDSLGANEVVTPDEETQAGPYDVVLELVGAGSLGEHLGALKEKGRIVFIGVGGSGPRGELDARKVMAKRAVVRGSTLRGRSLKEKTEAARSLERDIGSKLAAGEIRVPIEAIFPLSEAEAAYERFTSGGKFGKIALVRGEES